MKSLLTRSPDFLGGEIILIDKPLRWTSFDVVKKLRGMCQKFMGGKKIKVGHGGTLDPLATGLLTVCTGKKTKEIQQFIDDKKRYTGTFRLGVSSASFDLETELIKESEPISISERKIREIAAGFLGRQLQIPPVHSAKKIKGTRAYHHARKGETIVLDAKPIEIYDFQILKVDLPEIEFDVTCSKGTYIRTIADDFGVKLGTRGVLASLRRTESGEFNITQSLTITEFEGYIQSLSQQA